MRRLLPLLLLLLPALLPCGCGVYAHRPVGATPTNLAPPAGSAKSEWEGTWVGQHGDALTTRVLSEADGVLELACILEHDGELQPTSTKLLLRDFGGWTFVSMKDPSAFFLDPKEKLAGLYGWGRIKRDGNALLVWLPDRKKIEHLVREGLLPGTMRDNDVVLDDLGEKELHLLTSEDHGMLFMWDQPGVYFKVSG